jgi:hypothetical protein
MCFFTSVLLFNKPLEWVIYFHFIIFLKFILKLFFVFVLYLNVVLSFGMKDAGK